MIRKIAKRIGSAVKRLSGGQVDINAGTSLPNELIVFDKANELSRHRHLRVICDSNLVLKRSERNGRYLDIYLTEKGEKL